MFNIKLLENEKLETIYPVFLEVFEDDLTHYNMAMNEFIFLLESMDYHKGLSTGLYENEQLIGFCLNGFRIEEGRKFAFNIVTGVIPKKRRQGFASSMIKSAHEVFKKYNFDAWLLEIDSLNIPALSLYEKIGFRKYRSLYTMSKQNYQGVIEPLERQGIIELDVNKYWDFTPSWKNMVSDEIIKDEYYKWVAIGSFDEPFAYALFNDQTGIVLQFAVNYEYRNMNYGRKLLEILERGNHYSSLTFPNVPLTSYLREFLQKSGYITNREINEYILTMKQ